MAGCRCAGEDPNDRNPFHILLDQYLQLGGTSSPYLTSAMDLLQCHPTMVDPVHVISVLPQSLLLGKLEKFLLQVWAHSFVGKCALADLVFLFVGSPGHPCDDTPRSRVADS